MSFTLSRDALERILGRGIAALLMAATLACGHLGQTIRNGSGYQAKALASGVFVSGREAERVNRDDLSDGAMALVSGRVDPQDRSATARAQRWSALRAMLSTGCYRSACTQMGPA